MKLPLRGLRSRLFLAHLVVVALAAAALWLAATAAAPSILDFHVGMMRGPQAMGRPLGPPAGAGPGAALDAALQEVFYESLNQALLVAGLAALVAALVASTFAARQVAGPVRHLATAARRIAAGHYSERVPASDTTELGVLTQAFNDMATELENSEQRRLQLIGDVAHELRTPISTVEGYLEGLVDGVVEPSEETWTLLRQETERVRRLVEDLQELWRAEARQLPLQLTTMPPAALVESAVRRLEADFAAKDLPLSASVPGGLPTVRADHDRVLQVLTNLLSNALRSTSAPGEVEVSAAREGEAVRFSVRDTGIGLAPEHLERVFERFYRVDASRSRALGGSGVGLAIARALVEAMGGRIWAASPGPGHGATFSFTLPVA